MWYPSKKRTEQLDARLVALETEPADCDENVEDFLVRISVLSLKQPVRVSVPYQMASQGWWKFGGVVLAPLCEISMSAVLGRRKALTPWRTIQHTMPWLHCPVRIAETAPMLFCPDGLGPDHHAPRQRLGTTQLATQPPTA